MDLSIPTEIRSNHRELSKTGADFLTFARENPDVLDRKQYPLITAFSDGEGGTLQPWPTFINREARSRVSEAAVEAVKLVKCVPERIFNNDPAKIADYFKIPVEDAKASLYGVGQGDLDGLVARGDFILSASGFKCVEYNIAANLGGSMLPMARPLYRRTPVMERFVRQYRVNVKPVQPTIAALLDHLIRDALDRCGGCKEQNEVNVVFFSGNEENRRKKQRQIDYVANTFDQVVKSRYPGLKAELFFLAPNTLPVRGNRVYYRDIPIHAIVNFQVPAFGPLLESYAAGNLLLYNGNTTVITVQKLNIALLSMHEDSQLFSAHERQMIRKYIPWTRKIEHEKTVFKNEPVDIPEFTRTHREKLVIKHTTGLGGEDVYVGFSTPPDQWDRLLDRALVQGDWLVQEYHEPLPFIYQYGENGYGQFQGVWGLFVFGNRYIDGFLRVIPTEKCTGIINCKQGATVSILMEVDE